MPNLAHDTVTCTRLRNGEPILAADRETVWHCPLAGPSAWMSRGRFNPGAVSRAGLVHLYFRAEDEDGPHCGVSRVGLATSENGLDFDVRPEPVLHPDDDAFKQLDWPGGCEDPRVAERPDGGLLMLYTSYDGAKARLCVATTDDGVAWTKHGPAFTGSDAEDRWCKAGSIVTRVDERSGRPVACKINGGYWMYWGESDIFAATSDDLIRWRPVTIEYDCDFFLDTGSGGSNRVVTSRSEGTRAVLSPRPNRWDQNLVEPGPPAVASDAGILLIYNGSGPRPGSGETIYSAGWVVFDPCDPTAVLARCTHPMISPDLEDEVNDAQFFPATFVQGLVRHHDRWILYYGAGDRRVSACELSSPLLG